MLCCSEKEKITNKSTQESSNKIINKQKKNKKSRLIVYIRKDQVKTKLDEASLRKVSNLSG